MQNEYGDGIAMSEQRYSKFGKKEKYKGQWRYSGDWYSDGMAYGTIYKNYSAFYEPWRYKNPNEIVYIPEYGFPEERTERVTEDELQSSYTRQALIDLTGSEAIAGELFNMLAWQHPESLWDELCEDSDENGHWIEAHWAYEKVYLPDFASDESRKGQEPVCYDEFFHNEWRDNECRTWYLNRMIDNKVITQERIDEILKETNEEMC